MPAKSASQQRLFGMAYAYATGKMGDSDFTPGQLKKIQNITSRMSVKKIKSYASTDHDELSEKLLEDVLRNHIRNVLKKYIDLK